MKKEELRIGNLVGATLAGNTQPDESASEIDKALFARHGFVSFEIIDGSDIDYAQWYFPIPLTEEWLLKFGFKKSVTEWYLTADFMIINQPNGWYYSGSFGVLLGNAFQFVHQLQNLYFALTGEELKVTQK